MIITIILNDNDNKRFFQTIQNYYNEFKKKHLST